MPFIDKEILQGCSRSLLYLPWPWFSLACFLCLDLRNLTNSHHHHNHLLGDDSIPDFSSRFQSPISSPQLDAPTCLLGTSVGSSTSTSNSTCPQLNSVSLPASVPLLLFFPSLSTPPVVPRELSHHQHAGPWITVMPELWCSLSALTTIPVVLLAALWSAPLHAGWNFTCLGKLFCGNPEQALLGWSPSWPYTVLSA